MGQSMEIAGLLLINAIRAPSPIEKKMEIAGRELWSPELGMSSDENCDRWPVVLRWFFCFMEEASNQSKDDDD
jgi:hypothetical protein